MDIIENRIIEPERSGETISDATWYKWKRRYDTYGIDGLKNQSRKPSQLERVYTLEKVYVV